MHELTELLARYGLLLVFGNVLLTQVGIPVPAMPMLVVAGALAAQGEFGFAALIAVALAAALLGDIPWFLAGRRFGHRVLRTLCRIAIEPDSCVKQTENIFERWGAPSLIVAKYVPGFSTVAPPLAGAMGLGFRPFLLYSTLGGLLWIVVPVALGAAFHAEIEWVLEQLSAMGGRAALLVAAIVVLYAGLKAVERHRLIRALRAVRVTVPQLRELLGSATPPVILDVRSASVRRMDPRRLPGALPLDLDAVDTWDAAPPDRDVVVYCS